MSVHHFYLSTLIFNTAMVQSAKIELLFSVLCRKFFFLNKFFIFFTPLQEHENTKKKRKARNLLCFQKL
ncbi:MAG: hypothetical protein BWK80_06940 [Desulfobacteraceae bacterium IS3]|nr:MAG: hypothetical protein BWK80_06940 [Desulfobacteraceae bacterium IS3]